MLSFCSTRPASPAWTSQEPSDLSGLDQGDPLGLLQDVPWARSGNPLIHDYSRDFIIAIMEPDWLCTGVSTLICAAGGVYDFRNFEEVLLCIGLSSEFQNSRIPRKTSREYIL